MKKVVASAWSNDVPDNAMGSPKIALPASWIKDGYNVIDIGHFEIGAADLTLQIPAFKKATAEIVTGLFSLAEWSTFWRQSQQVGYHPKVATVAKAFLFPPGVQAMGKGADRTYVDRDLVVAGLPVQIDPVGANGQATARRRARPLGTRHQALKASGDPKDPERLSAAIAHTDLTTVIGRINWTNCPIKNVAKVRVVGGQWRILADQTTPQIIVTNNVTAPEIAVQRKFELLRAA